MMLPVKSLLLVLATVTIVHGQASICHSSLDCHGNVLDVALPEKASASAFASECCSAAVRGLSYQSQTTGDGSCLNCYNEADFESYGDKFYLGLFGNFKPTDFFRIGKVRLSVSPVTTGQSSFTLEALGKENKYTAPTEVELKAADVNLDSVKSRDQAIIVKSDSGDQLSVVAYAEEYSSSDTFKVMPCVRLPDTGYEYFAVSVPRAGLTVTNFITQQEIMAPLQGRSAIVIVTTEENTVISVTLTQDITNIDANDIMDQIGGGDTLLAGVEYSFTFSEGTQTLYLASEDDLTGSRVVSNKPIAFISGHECGTVPFDIHYCDQLIEQLPSTATWGKRFITAPIAGRTAVDIFKVVASRDNTNVRSNCLLDTLTLNAGEFREFNISSSSFCYFESSQPLLMVQFSVASALDSVLAGDPFMVIVPPIEQYRNSYNISIFNSSASDLEQGGENYINILVPADSSSPEQVRFDGQPLPPTVQFREISCVFSERTCAYAAQMNISSLPHFLTTSNPDAMINAIVYWLSLRVGHGYFAGMTQNPIALPVISLDQGPFMAMENTSLNLTILRSGDLSLPVTVYLTTAPISADNAALVGEDFIPETREFILGAGDTFLEVFINFVDDVFPEGPEEFEVFLSASPGALIVPSAYASVTILNDDPPLPVMNISFALTDIAVSEGEGVVTLVLQKTEGAIGPVSVRIFTVAGTAVDGQDFTSVNDTLEFGVDVTQMEVLIFITDNSALEDMEQFMVVIEPVLGVFPVAVMDSIATVTITDNDVVVLGFDRADYLTDEFSEGGAVVRVVVLVGQLERSVAVLINSTEASTATRNLDFEDVSRVLTFDAERSSNRISVFILDDFERETATETINLQLSFVEEERSSSLRLLPSQAIVNIQDFDEVEVGLSLIRGTVREGEGGARVNVSVQRGSLGDNPVSFIVSTANGTAQGGIDYVRMEEIVLLSAQDPFVELIIPILDDSEYEGPGNEIFFVQVHLDPNGQNSERVRISQDLAEVVVNIIDNELRPEARIEFMQEAWTVSEDVGELVLLVESDGSNVDAVTVAYFVQNQTAQDGSDFVIGMGSLLFPPGATLAAISVPIIDDDLPERTESFTVSLLPAQDVVLTTDRATITINDNDAVVVQFSMSSYTVSEAAAVIDVAVQISSATEPVMVNVSTATATALAGLDYLSKEVQLTFRPGDFEKMISIVLVNDDVTEGRELFSVSLHSPVSNLRVELPSPSSNVFIIDDDIVRTPSAPSLSVTSISATSASLDWTQDPAQPVTRFFLNWTYTSPCARQPPQSAIISGAARSFIISDLEEGGSYTFGLTAINGVGTSPESTTSGQTLPAVPSGAPRNLQTTAVTETSISIQWDEIECLEQNGAIVRYTVFLNSNLRSATLSTVREFTLTGLSPLTSYTISVFGTNEVGNGTARSITVQTSGRPVVVPSPPSLILGEQSSTTLSISWTQPSNDVVNTYIVRAIYFGNCSDFSAVRSTTLNGTARQFVFRNLQEFSTYQLNVSAVNSGGQSAESTLMADTRSAFPSVGPVPVLELTTETTITVRWNSIDCINENGPMLTYVARLNNGQVTITTSGTRAIFSSLTPMTNYTIDVRAENLMGTGPFGAALTVVTNTSGIAVLCYSAMRCDPAPGNLLGLISARQCCVNNPSGVSFNIPGTEICSTCIVFGFFQDSFIGLEQGPGHSVQVGYQKGAQVAAQDLAFNVVSTPGTASEDDYTVNIRQIRVSFRSPTPGNAVVTFSTDGIAQEYDETLVLELVPTTTLPAGENAFFRKYLLLTIVDNDLVSISFANDDYRASESSGSISVVVTKDRPIATPITLSIIPRTIAAQNASKSPLPPNVPSDNPRSPPYANLNDFNSTPVTLIIPPDEQSLGVVDFPVTIGIVDDVINEATEQVFVVQLQVVNSVSQSSIDLSSRPSSLCRIIDDDAIRIGFERPSYTYTEPLFEEIIDRFSLDTPVFLVKENNVSSEQTFLVAVQVTSSVPPGQNVRPATLDNDYHITSSGQTSVLFTFLPTEARINFFFTLFPDSFPEGDEAFRVSASPEDTQLRPDGSIETYPTFLNPAILTSETFVIIEDDDLIIIGFEETSYTTSESSGTLEVSVRVFSPPDAESLPFSIDLAIQTISGTASGGNDYMELNAETFDILLSFNDATRRRSFRVTINDDNQTEPIEDFTLELRPMPSSGVLFFPNSSTITIRDNDVVVGDTVSCSSSLNCTGGSLGTMSPRECCVGSPSSLAFSVPGSDVCIACVVVGFFEDSFIGVEQGPGHLVQVGYQKGAQIAAQDLVFNVVSIPDTARDGAQFDYTVNTLTVRALFSSTTPDNVVVTFRVDTIAQEPNQNFTLRLDPVTPPTARQGLFFRDTIEMTIIDSDVVEFLFSEDDFRANEPDTGGAVSLMPVIISKSTRIASPVILEVVPLTVDETRSTALPLPPNVPSDDLYSPPYADLNDFDNTSIIIIFEPDEDGTPMNERSAPIPIVDDAINEATEQVFIVELRLINSLDPATVDLSTRPSSLCRIIDNDPIRIGFELPGYTYAEPDFSELIDQFFTSPTGLPVNGPIYLAKENNVISEQTFLLYIQVNDSVPSGTNIQPATLGEDYRLAVAGQTSVTLSFSAFESRIPFQFNLFADTLSEGTEAFQVSLSPEDTRERPDGSIDTFPTFLNPVALASEIFVVIEDDDPISIGFASQSYTVNEADGMLQVTVQVFNPPEDQAFLGSVNLVIQTVPGTAIGGSDYQAINAETLDVVLIFDDDNRRQSFSVTIIDDETMENTAETFALELQFDPFIDPRSNILLIQNVSVVTITDDDDPTGMLRLVGGSNNLEGRVEIFANGDWGTVCDDRWGILDALVVCRQLGFAGGLQAFSEAAFGQGSGEILLDEVQCTGTENKLIDCPANAIGTSDCSHREDAGVRCQELAECTDGAVRLVNGSSSLSGRLEVCAFSVWGTVCDDAFNSNAATVACRQLGLAGGVVITSGYPDGTGRPIWLDNVACSGTEATLFDCPSNSISVTNCDHNEDVGVTCAQA